MFSLRVGILVTAIAFVIVAFSVPLYAAEYRIVPSGDPALPYRVEPINPLPSVDVATFDEAIATARDLEKLTGTIKIIKGDTFETATDTGICADDANVVQPCDNLPVTVE